MGFFGITDNERMAELSKQVQALQDSVELQRRNAAEAQAALTRKDEELRAAYADLQASQHEVASMKEKTAAEVKELKDTIDALRQAVAEKEAIISTLKPEEKKAEPVAVEEKNPPVEEQRAEPVGADVTPQLEAIKADLAQIREAYSDLVRKDDLFNSMHKELDTLRNDVYNKLTRPYKVSIISLYDSIVSTVNYYRGRKEEEGSYDRLMKQLDNFMLSIMDILCDEYNLDSFDAQPGDQFDRRAHKTMNVVETDDPAKHGTVARALQCGFKYMAFDPVKGVEREVIFRPAFVDTYKLKQQ